MEKATKKDSQQSSKKEPEKVTLKEKFAYIVEEFDSFRKDIEDQLQELDERVANWNKTQLKVKEAIDKAPQRIKLDVGGRIFATSKINLLRFENSYFYAMLGSNFFKPDSKDDTYFIDRDPNQFDLILKYLRDGSIRLDSIKSRMMSDFLAELDYFQLPIPEELTTNSKIMDAKQIAELIKMLPSTGSNKPRLMLLYRATKDGWAATDFHRMCDNKGATVTVIKSNYDYIVGGYLPVAWRNSGNYIFNANAFLFRLKPSIEKFEHLPTNQSHSVYDYSTYGPTFGGGHDLYIPSNSNSTSCSSNPHTYKTPASFAGGSSFTCHEIEVFQVN